MDTSHKKVKVNRRFLAFHASALISITGAILPFSLSLRNLSAPFSRLSSQKLD